MATRTITVSKKTWVNKAAFDLHGRVVIFESKPSDSVLGNYYSAEIFIKTVEEVFEVTANEFGRLCEKIRNEYPNRQSHTADVLRDVKDELGIQ